MFPCQPTLLIVNKKFILINTIADYRFDKGILVDDILSFSDILNLLFEHRTRTDGTPYRASDVSRATGVSASQLSLLMSGRRQNTSLETARAIIGFFDVSMEILTVKTPEQAISMIEDDSRTIQLRSELSKDLSPRALRQISEIIEWVIEKEYAERANRPIPPPPDFSDYI